MAIHCVAAEHGGLIKRNKLETAVIANALQFVAARGTPALSSFYYDVTPSLTSLNLFIATL